MAAPLRQGRPVGPARPAAYEQQFNHLSDEQLREKADALRGRARSQDKSSGFIAEGFGLCSVAIWRHLGLRPFDVQLAAGVAMFKGALVELATGEGKTLTAVFPGVSPRVTCSAGAFMSPP